MVNSLDAPSARVVISPHKGQVAAWAFYLTDGWNDRGIWKSAVGSHQGMDAVPCLTIIAFLVCGNDRIDFAHLHQRAHRYHHHQLWHKAGRFELDEESVYVLSSQLGSSIRRDL